MAAGLPSSHLHNLLALHGGRHVGQAPLVLQLLALVHQRPRALRLRLDALQLLAALVRVAPLHLLHRAHLREGEWGRGSGGGSGSVQESGRHLWNSSPAPCCCPLLLPPPPTQPTLSLSCSLRSRARRALSASRSAATRASSSSFSRWRRSTWFEREGWRSDGRQGGCQSVSCGNGYRRPALRVPACLRSSPPPHLGDARRLALLRLLVRKVALLLLARLRRPLLLLLDQASSLARAAPLLVVRLACLKLLPLLLLTWAGAEWEGGACK